MMNRENLDKYYLDRIPYPKDYTPTDWVKYVVNSKYKAWADVEHERIWICIGYDPNSGFWMENLSTKELKNISERAIDKTWHKVYER